MISHDQMFKLIEMQAEAKGEKEKRPGLFNGQFRN